MINSTLFLGDDLHPYAVYRLRSPHSKLRFILSTGPTLQQLEQSVHYIYGPSKAKRDSTLNESPLLF